MANKKFKNGDTLDRSSLTTDFAMAYVSNPSNNISATTTDVTQYINPIVYGNYTINTSTGKFYIKDTELLETGGLICGYKAMTAYIRVYNSDGSFYQDMSSCQSNPGGNLYHTFALPCQYMKLDKTKEYYAMLRVSGYQTNATLNGGYGESSYIYVKKIK